MPPIVIQADGIRVVMPVDRESCGTWIAGTDRGLAFAMLNLNDPARPAGSLPDVRSRGEIIPQLLGCRSADEVASAMADLRRVPYRPFRLIVVDARGAIELHDASRVAKRHSLSLPLMFTSSGLGDHLVAGPRRALFQRMMKGPGDLLDKQDRFHSHRWPARPHISVDMERADASTVSRTVLEVEGDWVYMGYTAMGQTVKPSLCGAGDRPAGHRIAHARSN